MVPELPGEYRVVALYGSLEKGFPRHANIGYIVFFRRKFMAFEMFLLPDALPIIAGELSTLTQSGRLK